MSNDAIDPAAKEALEHWGYLFQKDKCGTDMLNRLLSGIFNFIVRCIVYGKLPLFLTSSGREPSMNRPTVAMSHRNNWRHSTAPSAEITMSFS